MRSVLLALVMSLTLFDLAHGACSKPGKTAENTALTKRFYQAFIPGNEAVLDSVLSDDWRDIPQAPGQASGRDGMKAAIRGFSAVFNDFRTVNDSFVASGDKVVVRSTSSGVHVREFLGIPATGKAFTMVSIDIHTVCNGRIVETEHIEDWLGVFMQLGALPLHAK